MSMQLMSLPNKSFNALKSLPMHRPAVSGRSALIGAAAVLGASFLFVQARTRAAEKAHPPGGKFIEVDGVKLHYLEQGSGPVVVLLHGNGVSAEDFELSGLLDKLAVDHRVIAFDRPGFGYSSRPGNTEWTPEAQAKLVYDALHALKVENPVVVGHSWGTLVTLALALDFPRYVKGIVLVGGYFYPTARLDAAVASLAALPVVGQLWRYTLAPLVGRMMWPALSKQVFSPMAPPDRFKQLPPWLALRPSQLGATAAEDGLMVPAARRLSARYAELTLPIALLAGEGDKVVDPQNQSVRLHDDIKHSTLHLEAGTGHMAHYVASSYIADAVNHVGRQMNGSA
jgi:pimeloyl-ACP methyl ester carboxylesterase